MISYPIRAQAATCLSKICIPCDSDTYPIIISASLSNVEEKKLLRVFRNHKTAVGWQISDLRDISLTFSMHKIFMKDDFRPPVQSQRRLNLTMKEVVKKEVVKLLDAGIICPISGSAWVNPVQVVPKKGGITVVKNDNNELIPTHSITRWGMCIDYKKFNDATRKDHFPLSFMDQMLEKIVGHGYYCFLITLWQVHQIV